MDGVSLEMEKWKKVLTGMGHEVDIVAGTAAPGVDVIIPEIEYNDEANEKLNLKLYGHEPATEREIHEELSIRTSQILGSFRYALSGYDLVIPKNLPQSRFLVGPPLLQKPIRKCHGITE